MEIIKSIYDNIGIVGIAAVIVAVISLIVNIIVIKNLKNVSYKIECIADDLHGIRKNETLKSQGKILYPTDSRY